MAQATAPLFDSTQTCPLIRKHLHAYNPISVGPFVTLKRHSIPPAARNTMDGDCHGLALH